MTQAQDGGLIKTYAALSWIILRLYAVIFLGLTYVAVQWLEVEHPFLANLAFGYDPMRAIAVLGIFGLILLLPPLTPGFLRTPRNILSGALKAITIAGISYYFYLMLPLVLQAGIFPIPNAKEIAPLLPLVLKAIAGTAITGSILVALSQQLSRQRGADGTVVLSQEEIRNLRHVRMGQP